MAIIGFQKQFAALVESGEKRQTIRRKGKRVYKVGDRLTAYTGLRTKVCRKLGEFKIKTVWEMKFSKDGADFVGGPGAIRSTYPNPPFNDLALRNGFNSFDNLKKWFYEQYGEDMYKDDYQVIRW
jgi:hypothetical protein